MTGFVRAKKLLPNDGKVFHSFTLLFRIGAPKSSEENTVYLLKFNILISLDVS